MIRELELKQKPKSISKKLMIAGIIILVLILPFAIINVMLSKSWGQYRSKQWFNQNKESLVQVNDQLIDYLSDKADGYLPASSLEYVPIQISDEVATTAQPFELQSMWIANDDLIVSYAFESRGVLVTTSAVYGVYYSELDEPFTVIEPFNLAGNEYATEQIDDHWYFWWILY